LLDKKRVFGPPRDILEVQNAITAYRRIAEFTPLSMDSLLEAHGIMMKGLIADPGSLRQGPVGVIRENYIFHEAPHWEKVELMMQALFLNLNEIDDHLLIKSSRFHYQLKHIHPFIDGNSRMGRFWQTRLLMLYHPVFECLPVEHLIREHQQDYYRALAKGDDTGDCTGFVAFILTQIEKSLKTISTATASRNLHQGVKMGLLKRSGNKRTSVYQFKAIMR